MNKNIEIEFGEEPKIEIQPVTPPRMAGPVAPIRGSFWVRWQLFGAKN
jgi:hypothetical protein